MLARKYVQEYGFMGSNEHDFVPLNERGFFVRTTMISLP